MLRVYLKKKKYYQIGPDNHLLRETEYSQPSSLQGSVKYVSRIRHHLISLKYSKQGLYKTSTNKGNEFLPQTLSVSPFILATRCCRPLIFQSMNSVRSNSLS